MNSGITSAGLAKFGFPYSVDDKTCELFMCWNREFYRGLVTQSAKYSIRIFMQNLAVIKPEEMPLRKNGFHFKLNSPTTVSMRFTMCPQRALQSLYTVNDIIKLL